LWDNLKLVENEKEKANESFKKGDYDGAIFLYTELLGLDSGNKVFNSTILANRALCYQKQGNYIQALRDINRSIELNPYYVKAYYRRATVHIHLKNGERAKEDLQTVLKIDPSKYYFNSLAFKDAMILMEDLMKEEKRAKRKDYYKILEVGRNADEKDIRSAFRRLAGKWHPDKNNANEEQREYAERMFKDVNEAHAILMDKRKRHIFDHGGNPDDPNDNPENKSRYENTYTTYEPNYTYRYNPGGSTTDSRDNRDTHTKSKKKQKKGREKNI
jgi:DnaJ family protein C protein 7